MFLGLRHTIVSCLILENPFFFNKFKFYVYFYMNYIKNDIFMSIAQVCFANKMRQLSKGGFENSKSHLKYKVL